MKKRRTGVPNIIAAKVLFLSDRTCSVCRALGKAVQIHHIDDNPANNELANLAVLCLDCHTDTQLSGGFDRKLDADQVRLYRDDWLRVVARRRFPGEQFDDPKAPNPEKSVALITGVTEILRENREYELLAMYHHVLGNLELRDKYVDAALKKRPRDHTVIFLRGLQGRKDPVPNEVIQREVGRLTKLKDWSALARLYSSLRDYRKAVKWYVKALDEMVSGDRTFSTAFYLKEASSRSILDGLFELAYKEAQSGKNLWWQVRALQELGWKSELDELLLKNERRIRKSDDILLKQLLARSTGDESKYIELRKEEARMTHLDARGGVSIGKVRRPTKLPRSSVPRKRKRAPSKRV